MNALSLTELLKLSPAERMQLAQDLWDSIPEAEGPPLSEDQVREIERRLAAHDVDPDSAISWEQVRERLRTRFQA